MHTKMAILIINNVGDLSMILSINIIILTRIIVGMLCVIGVVRLVMFLTNKKKRSDANFLYKSPVISIAGGFLLSFCLTVWIYSLITGGYLELLKMIVASFVFFLLGLYALLLGINWRIDIHDESFDFRNLFGKRYHFKYSQISKVHPISVGGLQIVIDKVKISVDPFVINSHLLINKIENISNRITKQR